MNILHLSFVPGSFLGVNKKISYQTKALQSPTNHVLTGRFVHDDYYLGDNRLLRLPLPSGVIRKLLEPILFLFILFKLRTMPNFDIIYVRYMRITPWFYFFLKLLKRRGFKLAIEIPAYPYDQEYSKNDLIGYSDKFFRTKLTKVVDLFCYYGDYYDNIFGVDCLKLDNGIDATSVELVHKREVNGNTCNFIALANFAKWHGYDRLIKSVANLEREQRQRVHLHMVGDGPELTALKSLVIELGLDDHVTFYGLLHGELLNKVFTQIDCAVCSLGLYRIGHDNITPLKPAEYIARGIPILLGNNDPRFDKENFIFNVSNNDEIFDLQEIVDWINRESFDRNSIREYAIENLSWSTQMKRVVDALS
ncbi:glycosyltransferase [Vibrio cyclitrophicus]